jgi:DNA-binding response OmpR family regulator
VPATPPAQTKTTTLIIDPDEKSRDVIKAVLTRLNQNSIEVETAQEGLIAIERHDPDIVITEWQLPDMDAFKMFSKLNRAHNAKNLIQIVMSDRLTPEAHRKSKYIGINSFLDKPLNGGKVEILIGTGVRKALKTLKQAA